MCTKLNRADEISIKYIEDKGLVDFMKKFSSQRIILNINPQSFLKSEVQKLKIIKKQYPEYNFAIAMSKYDQKCAKILKEADIPFFDVNRCMNWERLHMLLKAGVSDINISGPLAFEMSKVKRVLEVLDRKVIIRATPNIVTNLNPNTNPLIGFYIRPEDVEVYEGFIDVLEFEGLEHQDTFFSIYAEQKSFIGNLNQCIYNFQEPIDNKGLITLFGERRRDCGRQCLSGGRCNRCYTLADLAKPMGERAREKIMETIKNEQEKMNNGKDLSN
jgi:hypothetical protein